MNELPVKGSHIHLIAVCGVGMASLAGLLKAQGYRVTGSDQNVYPPMSTYLAQAGIHVQLGFDPQHLADRPDLAIIGNAVSRANPEAEAVLDSNIPYLSFPQALGKFLIGSRQSIVVTGTHGRRQKVKIRPLQDRIIVKRIEEEEKSKGGIIIPDTAKEKPEEGKVVAVGKGKVSDDGKITPLDVKVNDRVLFGKYSGSEINIDGEEHLIMREDDVLGVLEK